MPSSKPPVKVQPTNDREMAADLLVSGCADPTINSIVRGCYKKHGTNHGKPVHKKDEKAKGLEVLVYYWDDRDGSDMAGWWFGPSVGGDQVWAFHPSRTSSMPPNCDWNVPHDGKIDPSFTISAVDKKPLAASEGMEAEEKAHAEDMRRESASNVPVSSGKRRRGEESADGGEGEATERGRPRRREEERRQKRDEKEERRRIEEEQMQKKKEDERKRLEEEARQKKELERRKDEEMQKKREEWRRQEEEMAKRRAEKERQKREEEERARAEEKKRRAEEEQQRREEEERQRREEAQEAQEKEERRKQEALRRIEQQAQSRREQQATLALLEVLSRFAAAMPEDFESSKALFDRAVETQLPLTGEQQVPLRAEADRVLRHTTLYVQQLREQRQRYDTWQSAHLRALAGGL